MKKINKLLLLLIISLVLSLFIGCDKAVEVPGDESSSEVSSSTEDSSDGKDESSSSVDESTDESTGDSDSSEGDSGSSSSTDKDGSSTDKESASSEAGSTDSSSGDEVSSSEAAQSSADDLSYNSYSQDDSIEAKIATLLAKMSKEEKVGQMIQGIWFQPENGDIETDMEQYYLGSVIHASTTGGTGGAGPDKDAKSWADHFEKLQDKARSVGQGIPLLIGIDAVHGNAFLPNSVVFPHNIGLGATRDENLVRRIGVATAKAVSATGIHWTFGPVANLSTNEKWGRMYESFGESESIVTPLTQAIVQGLQGNDLAEDYTISACAKHYLGDGVAASGHERGESDISDFAPHYAPYQAAVDMGLGAVMAGFTQVNGTRMHHSKKHLDYLKDDMGFDGVVVTDWVGWTVGYGDETTTIESTINAGVDMLMAAGPKGDPAGHAGAFDELLSLAGGAVSMDRIDDAVSRILRLKYRLGLFETTDAGHQYQNTVGSDDHRALAREAVQKSLTVLKNDGGILPLDKTKKYVVVGQHANNTGLTSGGWTRYWQGNATEDGDSYKADSYATDIWKPLDNGSTGTTILDGVEAIAGASNVEFDEDGTGSKDGDVAIVVIGEYPYAEWFGDEHRCNGAGTGGEIWASVCEEGTRQNVGRLSLTSGQLGNQQAMIDAYASEMDVVVVVVTGRSIPSDDAIDASKAFTVAWLPGSEGAGVADVLFGVAPATATLPHAWISSLDNLPYDGDKGDYPFGFGIEYDAVQ